MTLYYVLDPMCSWCYAFAPTWKRVLEGLDENLHVRYVHGGLAPHSTELMPQDMQEMLQGTWRDIEQRVGTKFNFDFWTTCKPRRSTYLACQASIAARVQGKEYEMIQAIQYEYYQNASNPSDRDTLERAAVKIGIDIKIFSHDLESVEIVDIFKKDLDKRRELGVHGFPSLMLHVNDVIHPVAIGFDNHEEILEKISSYM